MADPDPDYASMSEDELNALFAKGEGIVQVETEQPPEPAPIPVVEAEPEAEPEKQADPEPEAPPQEDKPIEDDLAASDAEAARIKSEKLEAALALQQAHASRLAGEIGYLKQKLESIPRPSEPYEPQSEAEMDRLSRLEQAFENERQARLKSEVSQAIESTINGLDGAWAKDLSAEISQIAPKYADQLKAAQETYDPSLARQIATGVVLSIQAEAKEAAWQSRRKSLEEKVATQKAELTARKKASAISGGGAVSSPRPAPKTYDQMTADELDAEMVKEFGSR